jgi:hypothetical protein
MEDRGGEEGYARFILIAYMFCEGEGVRIPTLECTLFYIYLNPGPAGGSRPSSHSVWGGSTPPRA